LDKIPQHFHEEFKDTLYAQLKQNMQLIGASVINDRLQDITALLLDAGIRFWVLPQY